MLNCRISSKPYMQKRSAAKQKDKGKYSLLVIYLHNMVTEVKVRTQAIPGLVCPLTEWPCQVDADAVTDGLLASA